MTNGANHTGAIVVAGSADVWTFTATQGDTVIISIAKSGGDTGFAPQASIRNPNNVLMGSAVGGVTAGQIQLGITVTGTHTVTVQDSPITNHFLGTYVLRLAKAPGAYTVGEDGGTMTNGGNHAGTVDLGDLDIYSFDATAGDSFILSVADTDDSASFAPELRVFSPTGAYLGAATAALADQIQLQATVTGTYTVVVSAYTIAFGGTGHYMLRLAKMPGAFTTPGGDDGGVMTNGANHAGLVDIGDLDIWSFDATQGDAFVLSIADTDNSATFSPELRVFSPTGAYLGAATAASADQIHLQATVTGTYTVVVSAYTIAFQAGGHYMLRLAKSPGAFVVPSGDEGGAMTNGANHAGTVELGDLDLWSFTATAGDTFILSVADTDNSATFSPELRVFAPTGAYLGAATAASADQIQLQATVTGTYTVVVSAYTIAFQAAGHYILRLAKSPGAFTVPTGDEGGAMTNGANHAGMVDLGDLDLWTFTANVGETFVLSVADTDNSATFSPELRVFAPTGAYLGAATAASADQIQLQATVTGTYTVVVSSYTIAFQSSGHYIVRLAKSPGTFVVPTGDDGGTLSNGGNHTGAIDLGDLDMWSFQANHGDTFVLSIADTDTSATFAPELRVFSPSGAYLGAATDQNYDQIQLQATETGTYTVVVSAYTIAFQAGGHYLLGFSKTPGTFVIPTGDQGGSLRSGTTVTGAITIGDLDPWSFLAAVGAHVSITVASQTGGFVPLARVFGPTGTFVLNTTGTGTITASTAGRYTILISSSTGVGSYSLVASGILDDNLGTTTTAVTSVTAPFRDNPQTIALAAAVSSSGGGTVNEGTVTFTVKNGGTTIGTPVTSAALINGSATANYILPGGTPAGVLTVIADYSGGTTFSPSTASGTLTVLQQTTYSLAEGATGSFFHTDLLLANPNPTAAPVQIDFLKEDGSTVRLTPTLLPTSRTTIQVGTVAGMESTAFSTVVTSLAKLPLVVERTMHWDSTGYGSSSEKANEGVATTWYFAEGSQGYFHTFFLLLNPQPTANVAHVTYVFEDATSLQRDYPLNPTSRFTVDAAADPALINRSFGSTVVFDQPGMAERAMYFGTSPLFSGGTAAAGVTAPATTWQMAEGATGSFFNTFVLIANPNDSAATTNVTYLLDNGSSVTRQHVISGHQRLTINVATEDASLESAAFGTLVQSDRPVVVERSQYWPVPNWYEAHSSMAVYALGTKWGLAEGEVGGAGHTQTYVLVANPNTQPAQLTVTFMRTDGSTIVKSFTVNPTSRFNIGVTGPGSLVPELHDESFATVIASTQPVLVERSMYSDANGVTWAAGTNATATRLP